MIDTILRKIINKSQWQNITLNNITQETQSTHDMLQKPNTQNSSNIQKIKVQNDIYNKGYSYKYPNPNKN